MCRLLAAVVAMTSGVSLACSCAQLFDTLPANGAVAPSNARVLITGNLLDPGTDFFLTTADQRVPALSIAVGRSVRLEPSEPLTSGLTYALPGLGASFTLSDQPDKSAPATPTVTAQPRETFADGASSCGGGETIKLEITGNEDDAVFYEVFAGNTVETIDFEKPVQVLSERFSYLSSHSCSSNFPLGERPDLALAVRAIDAAGNVSDFSIARQLKTAGCSTTPGLFVLISLIPLFRRKR